MAKLVAGLGIEPRTPRYERSEIPLLHPAIPALIGPDSVCQSRFGYFSARITTSHQGTLTKYSGVGVHIREGFPCWEAPTLPGGWVSGKKGFLPRCFLGSMAGNGQSRARFCPVSAVLPRFYGIVCKSFKIKPGYFISRRLYEVMAKTGPDRCLSRRPVSDRPVDGLTRSARTGPGRLTRANPSGFRSCGRASA